MFKRAALFTALSALVFACTGTADEGVDTATGAASDDVTGAKVFSGVEKGAPKCFEKTYGADHLARHPKQTVSAIRVELTAGDPDSSFEAERGAKITFTQKGQNPKIRDLACEDLEAGKADCNEDTRCTSSVDLVATANGLRMTNHNLRASGACGQPDQKALNAASGADDVFDLIPVDCNAGVLANPPTVECGAVIMQQRSCIDVLPQKCDNMITKGARYADEFQTGAAEGVRLESAAECVQRFTDVVEETGCCGG